jgi:hypothetical protein
LFPGAKPPTGEAQKPPTSGGGLFGSAAPKPESQPTSTFGTKRTNLEKDEGQATTQATEAKPLIDDEKKLKQAEDQKKLDQPQ